jgi:hypothetical protein
MKTYGAMDVYTYVFLTSELVGGEWSASRSGRFTPRERSPVTHWIWGWVGPRAGLGNMEKWKFLPPPRTRTLTPQPVAIPTALSRLIRCLLLSVITEVHRRVDRHDSRVRRAVLLIPVVCLTDSLTLQAQAASSSENVSKILLDYTASYPTT